MTHAPQVLDDAQVELHPRRDGDFNLMIWHGGMPMCVVLSAEKIERMAEFVREMRNVETQGP